MMSRYFGTPPSCRIHCAACGLLFVARRPSPGDRVECPHCGEIVRVGRGVLRKLHSHSSRNSLASWMDPPRSAGAESVGRVAICTALAAGVVFLLASFCTQEPSPGQAAASGESPSSRLEAAIFDDTNGW